MTRSHGIAAPNFRYTDTLSKAFTEERAYDVVLANPPFKCLHRTTPAFSVVEEWYRKHFILVEDSFTSI